jgi:DNA topoisomerase-3
MSGKRPSRGQTHWEVGDDAVLWLFGHVIELVEPHDYNPAWKSWHIDTLPMFPKEWRHEPTTAYTPDYKVDKDKTKAILGQVNACKALLRQADIVVNAGDPEREGQLLVDELLIFHNWDPFNERTMRFWSQSLTENEVIKNITNMIPNARKKNLYMAAFARQRADWLHGLNMTRLYTLLARKSGAQMTLSVGRVQTPTLWLVVTRDLEIANFKPVKHYLPSGWFSHQNGKFKAKWVIPADHPGVDPEGYLTDRSVAEGVLAKIAGKQGVISEFETKNEAAGPPLPYKLSTLQQACSAKFGLTAEQTLQVAQSLYEKHKATSYPRTDSQHLPLSVLKEEAPSIMASMTSTPGVDKSAQSANMSLRSKAWDDSKVSDHHGIIPTTEFHAGKLADMSPIERNVFMLIAKSFVAQFHPDQTWKSMTANVKCEGLNFRATGRIAGNDGWKVVFSGEVDEEDSKGKEENQAVPQMKKGDPVTAEKGELKDSTTKPPKHYTDGTLIAAMTDVHKYVPDSEIKKRLKENAGIGTEATRASIIEGLIRSRKFLKRDGKGKVKNIVSTDTGRSVIAALPSEMTSPALTALWEAQLEKIEKGEFPAEQFMQVLHDTLRKRVDNSKNMTIKIKGQSIEPIKGDGETCQECKKGTMRTSVRLVGEKKERKIVLSCDGYNKEDPNSCRNTIWPDRPKAEPVPPAKGHGETCKKCGKGQMITAKSAKGTIYLKCNNWKKDAPNNCDNFAFPESDGPKCDKCGKGHMRKIPIKNGSNAGKFFFSCSEYPACDNKSFPDDNKGGSSGGRSGAKSGSNSTAPSKSKTSPSGGARNSPFGKK